MEGGMNVAFSAISNALFWQIPTKQPSLTLSLADQATSDPLLSPRPPKKEHTSNICHAHGQGAVAGGTKL